LETDRALLRFARPKTERKGCGAHLKKSET
jgi:hypothetical protein